MKDIKMIISINEIDLPNIGRSINRKLLMDLKENIEDNGLINPITVLKTQEPNEYKLLDGYHRFKAWQELGHTTILAYIKEKL